MYVRRPGPRASWQCLRVRAQCLRVRAQCLRVRAQCLRVRACVIHMRCTDMRWRGRAHWSAGYELYTVSTIHRSLTRTLRDQR